MATRTTVLRNTGVLSQAAAQGKTVQFTYTDASGKVTKRRKVTVQAAEKTRHNPDAVIVRGIENGNLRSFRTDRMLRARIVN